MNRKLLMFFFSILLFLLGSIVQQQIPIHAEGTKVFENIALTLKINESFILQVCFTLIYNWDTRGVLFGFSLKRTAKTLVTEDSAIKECP